ncbi:hypothetical protein QYF36_018305 [Acer negundo]|nr:hypothetical protein QYF36_018305 [Acer negundo]
MRLACVLYLIALLTCLPVHTWKAELIRWIDLEPTPSWQNRSRDMKNRIQMQIRSVELLVMVVLVLVDVVAVMMNLMMKMRLRDSGRRRCRIDDACVIVVAVVIR